MTRTKPDREAVETQPGDPAESRYERWHHWPVNWSAIWVGALAALSAALVFGLIGVAVGAHLLGPEHRVVDLRKTSLGALVFGVCGAFFAFVIGGWVAGKVAGILRSEPAMLHGAIVWLVATPLLVVLVGLGAGSLFGGWYAGLGGTPAGAAARTEPGASASDGVKDVEQLKKDAAQATRNAALGALTALLLGLVGSVIGGWMACGEPMTLTYHRNRPAIGTGSHPIPS